MKDLFPISRLQRIRHEIHRREVEAIRVERISPGFIAVTFAGDSLAGFVSPSFEDHVKFMFTDADGELVRRDYTPRRFNSETQELTIEFGIHAGGRAAAWARQVVPGQKAVIAGPRGSLIIPKDYDWHLLAGDAAALPAIHRRLEELPADARAIVLMQLDEVADRREFHAAAQLDVQWASTSEELVAAMKELSFPSGKGFVWCAGETSTMSRLRQILRDEKAVPQESLRVVAYWKQGASDFHEALANPPDEVPATSQLPGA